MVISRSIKKPIRDGMTTEQLWKAGDNGLIASWESGRALSKTEPELAELARNGELPIMGWKGGVSGPLKSGKKYGSLRYLAMWQGLRNENLNIDAASETEVTCARTGVTVTYTPDASKYSMP